MYLILYSLTYFNKDKKVSLTQLGRDEIEGDLLSRLVKNLAFQSRSQFRQESINHLLFDRYTFI